MHINAPKYKRLYMIAKKVDELFSKVNASSGPFLVFRNYEIMLPKNKYKLMKLLAKNGKKCKPGSLLGQTWPSFIIRDIYDVLIFGILG